MVVSLTQLNWPIFLQTVVYLRELAEDVHGQLLEGAGPGEVAAALHSNVVT